MDVDQKSVHDSSGMINVKVGTGLVQNETKSLSDDYNENNYVVNIEKQKPVKKQKQTKD